MVQEETKVFVPEPIKETPKEPEEVKEPVKPSFSGLKKMLAKQNEDNAELNKDLDEKIKKIEENVKIHKPKQPKTEGTEAVAVEDEFQSVEEKKREKKVRGRRDHSGSEERKPTFHKGGDRPRPDRPERTERTEKRAAPVKEEKKPVRGPEVVVNHDVKES